MTDFLLNLIAPAVVWIASYVATLAKKAIPDAIMTGVIVPTLVVIVAWLEKLVLPDAPFMVTVLIGRAATFFREFTKNSYRAVVAMFTGKPVERIGGNKA